MLISFLIILQLAVISGSLKIDKWTKQLRDPLDVVLNMLIDEISQRSKCMVFILDPFYSNFIHYRWLNRQSTPYFTIRIRESEEFTPPRHRMNAILMHSKNSVCDAYIILIANGYQVNELLQYAESKRLLNTQSKFLLIHDSRLFIPEMKYLWNRINNVIFIRRFSALKLRSGEKSTTEWFNLETIHYPMSNGTVRTYYLDTWYKGRFRIGDNHFMKRVNNLQQKELKVAVFEHIPAVTKYSRMFYTDYRNHSNGALGIEFEIIRVVSQKLNFKPVFYRPKDVELLKWGTADINGSYDGLLGEAIQAKAAFLIGDLHYTLRHYSILDLSYPYNTECLTFITPEALTENSWKLLIVPFTLYSWIAVLLILFIVAYTFHVFALFYRDKILPYKVIKTQNINQVFAISKSKLRKNKLKPLIDSRNCNSDAKIKGLSLFTDLQNSVLYTYSALLQVSLPTLPDVWALRVFIGWWWLYSILVTVAYRASLTASLANPIGRVTIDTFSELAKSPISVGGWGEDKKDPLISSSDIDLNKIGEKFQLINSEDNAIARVANGTFGYYENIYVLKEARAKRQLLESDEKKSALNNNQNFMIDRDLHIMRECVINIPISIGMDKNSPLKDSVDLIVRNVVEAGLVAKWLSDVVEWSKISEIKYESDTPKALVSLKKLYGAFVALGIGCLFGLIALVAEHLHWKFIVMKNPDYDKYQMDIFYEKIRQKKIDNKRKKKIRNRNGSKKIKIMRVLKKIIRK